MEIPLLVTSRVTAAEKRVFFSLFFSLSLSFVPSLPIFFFIFLLLLRLLRTLMTIGSRNFHEVFQRGYRDTADRQTDGGRWTERRPPFSPASKVSVNRKTGRENGSSPSSSLGFHLLLLRFFLSLSLSVSPIYLRFYFYCYISFKSFFFFLAFLSQKELSGAIYVEFRWVSPPARGIRLARVRSRHLSRSGFFSERDLFVESGMIFFLLLLLLLMKILLLLSSSL